MSWTYLFDDEDADRTCVGDWLENVLGLKVAGSSSLPPYRTWLKSYGDRLPDLVVLDLFAGGSMEATCQFARAFRASPETKNIPLVILSAAPETTAGVAAIEDAKVDEFLPKKRFFRRLGRDRWEIDPDLAELLRAKLQNLVLCGSERRRAAACRERLSRLLHHQTFAIFESRPPWRLLDGSPSALKHLFDYHRCVPDQAAPEKLRAGLKNGKQERVTVNCLDDRHVTFSFAADRVHTILVTLQDEASRPYIRAFGEAALTTWFRDDYRELMSRHMVERFRDYWPEAPDKEELEKIVDGIKAFVYALTCGDLPAKLSKEEIVTEAHQWQCEHLKRFGESFTLKFLGRYQAPIYAALREEWKALTPMEMVRRARELRSRYPVVEATQ